MILENLNKVCKYIYGNRVLMIICTINCIHCNSKFIKIHK